MRSIIGVCTSPPEAESFSFGCTSFDEREKRRERGREKEIAGERRPPTYRRVRAVDEYTTVLRSPGFISALKMPSPLVSFPISPLLQHRCSFPFAKPTRDSGPSSAPLA